MLTDLNFTPKFQGGNFINLGPIQELCSDIFIFQSIFSKYGAEVFKL